MAKPTPWGPATADQGGGGSGPEKTSIPETTGDPVAERAERHRAAVRAGAAELASRVDEIRRSPRLVGKWSYVVTALGSIITFALMFRDWMVAKGPDGSAAANAFGRIDANTKYLTVWSKYGPNHTANLTGFWAVAASAALAVTVFAVVLYIITESETMARTAAGAAVLGAVLVISTVLYLTVRQKHLKDMTMRRWDLGGQLGSLMNWAFSDGSLVLPGMHQTQYVATGTLTASAMAAVVVSVGSAVVALAQLLRSTPRTAAGGIRRINIPWRINITRTSSTQVSAAQNAEESTTERTETVTETSTPAPPKPPAAAGTPATPPEGSASAAAEGPDEPGTAPGSSDESKPR
ncbi:hypothetical protein [Nocardia paucivorans]|uniref:hypothetical protein n=1 Tax=Nocardia paucivorans TaxID=114259 RepID=UPI00031C4A8E|nr:hypothetical protein [Nocardia paucivorans]